MMGHHYTSIGSITDSEDNLRIYNRGGSDDPQTKKVSRHTIHELTFLQLDPATNEPIEVVNPLRARNGIGPDLKRQLSSNDLRSHFSPLHDHHLPDKAQVVQYYLTVTPNLDTFHHRPYRSLSADGESWSDGAPV